MSSNLLAGSEPSTASKCTVTPDPAGVNEGFIEGGNLTLQSLDGVEFNVHSLFLSAASPIFSKMFETSIELVTLEEKSDLVALMLKFIYPKPTPVIPSFDTWTKAMEVAKKYQLERMHSHLRALLSTRDSPTSIYGDPLRGLAISLAEGFQKEADLAKSLASRNCRFQRADELLKIVAVAPAAAPWIKLIGKRLATTKILTDVLFSFHKEPMLLTARPSSDGLFCDHCYNIHSHRSHSYSPPEWQARWAHCVFEEIQNRPVNEWNEFFGISFLTTALFRNGEMPISISDATCTCLEDIIAQRSDFLNWTSIVCEHLKKQLRSLDRLETL